MAKMDALLLAAGFGTRMRPISLDIPKPLIPLANIPLIEIFLRDLHEYAISNFVINSFHLKETLKRELARIGGTDLNISLSDEEELLGTGGGIKRMLGLTREKLLLVSNTDAVYHFDLRMLARRHLDSGMTVTLIIVPYPDGSGYSRVAVDKEGFITDFHFKGKAKGKGIRAGVFSGIHIISRDGLPEFPSKDVFCIIDDYYSHLIKAGFKIRAEFPKGSWIDSGEMPKYFAANQLLLRKPFLIPAVDAVLRKDYIQHPKGIFIHNSLSCPEEVLIKAPVVIGARVTFGEGTAIGPGVVVGSRSRIGRSSVIRESVVLPESVINDGSKITGKVFFKKPIDPFF